MLDPFQYEPKERKVEEENGFMEEDEENILGGF